MAAPVVPVTSFVLATTPVPHVRVLALNRPEKRNALSQGVIDNLLNELKIASAENQVKVIIVTGTISAFSGEAAPWCKWGFWNVNLLTKIKAGADIKEIANLDSEAAERSRYLEDLGNGIKAVRKPVLAAVEGMAVRDIMFIIQMIYTPCWSFLRIQSLTICYI
jgi:enoyl-CoA hydratase